MESESDMHRVFRQIFGPALGLAMATGLASSVWAADLSVKSRTTVVRHHHYKVIRAVRDYDGTPIVIRRRPDGTSDTYLAMRASPTRYLNGQPVAP